MRPISFNLRAHRPFGDVWRINILARREGFVVTCQPDHVRSLPKAKPDDAPSLTGESALRPIPGANSILTSVGARHMRQRKLLLPPFHGEAVQQHVAMIAEVAEREIDRWPLGEAFALAPRMSAITLDVIMSGIFGIEGKPARGRAAIVCATPSAGCCVPPPTRCFRSSSCRTSGAESRRPPTHWPGPSNGCCAPRRPTTLCASTSEPAGPDGEAYVEATIHEAMRNRPVIPMIVRMVKRPWRFGDYTLPARTAVAVSIVTLHHREDLYPDPLSFRPERLLDHKQPDDPGDERSGEAGSLWGSARGRAHHARPSTGRVRLVLAPTRPCGASGTITSRKPRSDTPGGCRLHRSQQLEAPAHSCLIQNGSTEEEGDVLARSVISEILCSPRGDYDDLDDAAKSPWKMLTVAKIAGSGAAAYGEYLEGRTVAAEAGDYSSPIPGSALRRPAAGRSGR